MNQILSALLAVTMTLTSTLGTFAPTYSHSGYALKEAAYSERELQPQATLSAEDCAALRDFTAESTALVFADTKGKNTLYSPLSLWSAMAVLAQCADNNSRAQVLDALSIADIAALQKQVGHVQAALPVSGDKGILSLDNSVWLNSSMPNVFVPETLNTLASQYYASTYAVPMGTKEADQAVTDWTAQYTNGLLGGGEPIVETKAETLALLVSSLYYKAEWSKSFSESATSADTFTNAGGQTSQVDFMHQTLSGSILLADTYQAAVLPLTTGNMTFILPKEGTSPESLLKDGAFLSALDLVSGDVSKGKIRWSVPKMDIDAELDLLSSLEALGVSDLLDAKKADLSALTTLTNTELNPYVSGAKQMVRVKADEKGVEAAGVTVIEADIAMAPPENEPVYEMNLNRPFLFVIHEQDVPLFVGVVNQL